MSNAIVTQMLGKLSAGDATAAERLLPLVYDELRALADRFLRSERPDHTLQATALVHEAFLRLVDQHEARVSDRAHFYRIAALAMRRILVNHARDRGRIKRGAGAHKLPLDHFEPSVEMPDVDFEALDRALDKLAAIDDRKVQVVQLRYFGGLSVEETAEALGLSVAQIKRDWALSRAWLLSELQRNDAQCL
ncbi:MAG: sigma-70 family RNA polymerase sigma factor [Phycisphaerae bacterium]|nr:sigma-70 family RNA polymerase sigma factor [Phycisphaerae bacterium]